MGKHTQRKPRLVEHLSDDDDDEEISEDEAFDSADEAKYGSFFEKRSNRKDDSEDEDLSSDGEESENGLASDEDGESEEGDGGQYMLELLDKVDAKEGARSGNNGDGANDLAKQVKESPFSTTVLSSKDKAVTLNSLMEGLRDSETYGRVQKGLKPLAKGQAASTPAARVVADRAQRKVHYEDQSKNNVSQWLGAVQENRQAETLDFRHKERLGDVSRDALVDKFVPTTDFERQLQSALEEAGQNDEEALAKAEEQAFDDLQSNEITMEDYKQRQGQLAKMRALMFYHEQKRHHMNKIKSKKYRRIRKKQRERLKDAELEDNPDLERDLLEKEELERMQERMTLAHKNTSKWAKRVLKRGKNVDVDTRRALSAQLKRGDDLLKRMHGRDDASDDEDEDLVETAKKVLADTEGGDEEEEKGVFKLAFMQRGIKRQREQAKQEARQLLLELEENERLEKSDDEHDNTGFSSEKKQKSTKTASKEEMKNVLKDGEMVASSLKYGASSNAIQMSGGIDIDAPTELQGETKKPDKTSTSEYNGNLVEESCSLADNNDANESKTPKKRRRKKDKEIKTVTQEDSNPWLIGRDDESASKPAPSHKRVGRKDKLAVVDLEGAVGLVSSDAAKGDTTNRKEEAVSPAFENTTITTLSQEELVRRAFAGTTAQEAEEEFAKEKEEFAEREDPTRKKNKKKQQEESTGSSGWGSWAGKGAPPPRLPKRLPAKFQPPKAKKPNKRNRRDEHKPTVILSERRMKKLAESCMVPHIPHPYKSRVEYERAMAGGVGKEWNVSGSHKDMTRPEIQTRSGQIIQPLSMRVKKKTNRAAAKF